MSAIKDQDSQMTDVSNEEYKTPSGSKIPEKVYVEDIDESDDDDDDEIPFDRIKVMEVDDKQTYGNDTRETLNNIKRMIMDDEDEDYTGIDPQGFLTNLYGVFCGSKCITPKEDVNLLGPYTFEMFCTQHKETTLRSAVAMLLSFIQENFTGPFHEREAYAKFIDKIPGAFIRFHLRCDGEELHPSVRYIELFQSSRQIMKFLLKTYPDDLLLKWWQMRIVLVHQKILEEITNTLYEQFKNLSEILLSQTEYFHSEELEIFLNIEVAQGYLLFKRVQNCEEILKNISQKYNVDIKIQGVLGMRTRYQQKPLPILCLKAKGAENLDFNTDETFKDVELPTLLKHEDDTRLERVKFINEEDNEVMKMPHLVQALVLTKLKHVLKSQPKDRLSSEEVEPYINSLLFQEKGSIAIRLTTLLLNVEQECNSKRTVERCLKQLEEIIELIKSAEKYFLKDRLRYFFLSMLPPHWEMKKLNAEVMVSLGLIKSALDVYIDIQSWENVINCYNILELKHKSAEIIEQEIEKNPTIKLYCLLGDATDDPDCYEIAWDMSSQTSSLAQRHWGNYYYAKKDYETALPHLEKTVEINSLQEVQWLRLGYAAIQLEKWELAVKAYITYTHLEPNGFESWNNLAKALIKVGDKPRAHKILQESLKCNFNNWKVWENFMAVSIDTGNFEDAFNSYERLIELKDNFFDYEVLEILVKAVSNNLPDSKSVPSSRLKKSLVKILGHQCVKYASNWKLWNLSALLAPNSLNKAQKLQRSFRAYIDNDKTWTLKKDKCIECASLCQNLCETSLAAINDHDENEKSSINSQLSSARLSAQSCTTLIEKSDEKFDEVEQIVNNLQELHIKLTEELKQRM